ncbi:Uncharacterised protein [uncultured archaeon]|nr:Uncharacterised protein [uncultured archaeon]
MESKEKVAVSDALTITELIPRLKRYMSVRLPVFLWGGPGVGKSSVIRQLIEAAGGICIDIRLSQMSPTDIIGIPYFDKNVGLMKFAPPSRLPSEELASKYPIIGLLLDELSSAPPSVQAAAYELILDRRAGEYHLPENVMVFAAGNRESDRGVTYRLAAPLANRMGHFELKVDFDSWLDWALITNQHPLTVSYLSAYHASLYDFDPESISKSFPSPRSWEFFSRLLYTDTKENPLSDSEMNDLCASCVGAGEAIKFMTFQKIGKNLPKPMDILTGKVKHVEVDDISAHYQLIVNMLYELRDIWTNNSKLSSEEKTNFYGDKTFQRNWNSQKKQNEWLGLFENYNYFILNEVSLECGIMAARMALKNYHFVEAGGSDLITLASWKEITKKFFKYVRDAHS